RAAWTLARLQGVGVARNQREIVAPAVEDESQLSHHHFRAEAAVQARSEGDGVALLVDHGYVAGVPLMLPVTFHVDVARPLHSIEARHILVCPARPEIKGGLVHGNQLTALLTVLF